MIIKRKTEYKKKNKKFTYTKSVSSILIVIKLQIKSDYSIFNLI